MKRACAHCGRIAPCPAHPPRPAWARTKRNARPGSTRAWRKLRAQVFARDGCACVDCGSRERLEADHLVPHAQRGTDTPANLVTRCAACDARGHGRVVA